MDEMKKRWIDVVGRERRKTRGIDSGGVCLTSSELLLEEEREGPEGSINDERGRKVICSFYYYIGLIGTLHCPAAAHALGHQ